MIAYDEIIKQWNFDQEYVVFGNPELLEGYIEKIKVKYIVDNKKKGIVLNGLKIYSPEALMNENKVKIIIANKWASSISSIRNQLVAMGISKELIISYKKLLSVWRYHYENIIEFSYIEYLITTKCTLKCKNCILFMPDYDKPAHTTFEEIKMDMEAYFRTVDRVRDFRLLGGEPFTHPQLKEILRYICSKYRDKIGNFEIVTNGTIPVIDKELFSICRMNNILIHISDYTQTVDYRKNIEIFISELQKNNVNFIRAMSDNWSWKSVNGIANCINKSETSKINMFENCQTHCRCLYDQKIFYCSMHASALRSGKFTQIDNSDYFDLNYCDINIPRLFALDFGDLPTGCVSFCSNCNGQGDLNKEYVIPGEQLEGKE